MGKHNLNELQALEEVKKVLIDGYFETGSKVILKKQENGQWYVDYNITIEDEIPF